MCAGEAAMQKYIPTLKQVGFSSILDLPRLPPVMRICATSNGEQRVQVLIPAVQGLSQKEQKLMQQYFEIVDW